jgi:hypothetical protein
MSIVFDKAPKETHEIIAAIAGKHHPDLVEAKAKIECLVARREGAKGEKIGGSAVRENGYPRAAKIKITSLHDRTLGMEDVVITLDEKKFDDMTPDEKAAVIDQQLERIEVMREGGESDTDKPILLDKWGRPRMKLKKFDHSFLWFNSIAERHADASREVQEAKHFFDEQGQGWFGTLPFNAARPPESLAEQAGNLAEKPKGNGNGVGNLTMTQKRALKATRTALKDKIEQRITDAGLTFTPKSAEVLGTWLSDGKPVMELNADALADCAAKLDEIANDVIVNVVKSSGASA